MVPMIDVPQPSKVNLGPLFKANINYNQYIAVADSSIVFLLLSHQYSMHHQDSIISDSQTHLNVTQVSILKCHPQAWQSRSGFPINWVSRGYWSLNLDASILLSLETFCQQSMSSQHPRLLALSTTSSNTVAHILYRSLSTLLQTSRPISPDLISCIAALLDLWIASQEGFKG
jgi:hypothetical protein